MATISPGHGHLRSFSGTRCSSPLATSLSHFLGITKLDLEKTAKMWFLLFKMAAISQGQGQLGHLLFCNADYPNVFVKFGWIWSRNGKVNFRTSIRAAEPVASTKSNMYRSLFHVGPNQSYSGGYTYVYSLIFKYISVFTHFFGIFFTILCLES